MYERNLVGFLTAAAVLGFFIWAVIIAGVGLAAKALAEESWMVVSGISYHLDRNGQNEKNWGLGREHRLSENNRLGYGTYHNSSNRFSAYMANAYTPIDCYARCGVIFGLVTGYEREQKPAILGGLAATVERGNYGMNLIFIPAAGGVLFVQAKVRW